MPSPSVQSSPKTFIHPRQKLKSLAKRACSLWVVVYVDQPKKPGEPGFRPISELIQRAHGDVDACIEGNADGVVLINEFCSLEEFEPCVKSVREAYPELKLGVNYLGDERETYGFGESFRLAKDYSLEFVWTDFAGVDDIVERAPVSLHDIEAVRPDSVFYCSGVHMKYSTLKDQSKPIEKSALQALGFVDGVIITGPKTGVPCPPENVKRVREVIGNYPLGLASGVSADNVREVLPYIDFALVASSLQNSDKRIVKEKVSDLCRVLDEKMPQK